MHLTCAIHRRRDIFWGICNPPVNTSFIISNSIWNCNTMDRHRTSPPCLLLSYAAFGILVQHRKNLTGDAIYFEEFVILFIHWRKYSNGLSKFSGFFLCWTKIPNAAYDNNKHGGLVLCLSMVLQFHMLLYFLQWIKRITNSSKYIASPVNSTGEVHSLLDYSPVTNSLHNLPVKFHGFCLTPKYIVNFHTWYSKRNTRLCITRVDIALKCYWEAFLQSSSKYIASPVNSTGEVHSLLDYSPMTNSLHNLPVNRIFMNMSF
jgi:hypothetical protein